MNKQEYIEWTKNRNKQPIYWEHSKCLEADKHIKTESLRNLEKKLPDMPLILKQWIMVMARFHSGDMETNELMIKLNCYPDYMV